MSISQDTSASTNIICQEVFDENSQPSEAEVLEYAKRLGVDPEREPELLDLAREGLMAALPKGWQPIYDDNAKTFYYHQKSTNITTWEHPLDPVYKDLIAQARVGNRRRTSVEITRDEMAISQGAVPKRPTSAIISGLPPPVPASLKSPSTRIPMKLAPLKRHRSESASAIPRRHDNSLDRMSRAWKSGDSDPDSARSSLSSDRASRDYTNLKFQDPEFYESPKVLENKKKLEMRDVLKRSESLSPRHEKEWAQLTGRFGSDENIIDVDLPPGIRVRTPVEESTNPFLKGSAAKQHPKELTLSGGGSMFLKSNRSRETTPCYEGTKSLNEEPQPGPSKVKAGSSMEEMTTSVGERLKSILREKTSEDDDERSHEERKSVRFDLERVAIQTSVTKFNESGSEDEEEEEEEGSDGSREVEERAGGMAATLAARRANAVAKLTTVLNRQGGPDFENSPVIKKINIEPKKPLQVVGRRFVVENVSEKDHLLQQESRSTDNEDEYPAHKFENIKNIDIPSRSDSEKSLPRSTSGQNETFLDELRRSKEIMLENMRKSEFKNNHEENDKRPASSLWMRSTEQTKDSLKSQSETSLESEKSDLMKEYDKEIDSIKQRLDQKLEQTKIELEDTFNHQKLRMEADLKERMEKLKKEMALKEEQEIQKLVADMDETRAENLKKARSELEACYEKERQDILTNLKSELDQRKRELLQLRSNEISKLESEHERGIDDEVMKQHAERIDNLKKEMDKEFDDLKTELRSQQREKIAKITEEHEKCLADILKDFRVDENLARKVYKQRLDEIRAEYTKDVENEVKKYDSAARQDNVDFEKMRCEKRLLEDKYNTLKEKYLKMKKDMRAAIEKRNRRKEQQANATASETEMSTSTRTRTDRTDSTDQKSGLTKTNSISHSKSKEVPGQNVSTLKDSQQPTQPQRVVVTTTTVPVAGTAAKAHHRIESDDTTTCSETTSNLLMSTKKKKILTKNKKQSSGNRANNNNNNVTDNPVENIRKQLEKLEDLGDQLPSNDAAYTVRYPFHDKSPGTVSSELEFFRHRIHVERVSVKRAREALRQQRSAFQTRQKAWKQLSAKASLEQLVKEERELADMEVSLHRTRSLLGEKIIHLRHLEQSLERMANAKRIDNEAAATPAAAGANPTATANKSDEMSDMSSASSGFSSTELGTDTFIDKYCHYQESTEIIASLENLNSEIREIWGVLNKRQDNSVPPPPTLMFTDLSWFPYQHLASQSTTVPATAFGTPNIQSNILSQLTANHPPGATQNIIAQYGPTSGYSTSVGTVEGAVASNLIERTRNLKDWLRQARVETSDLVSPGQATL